MLGHDKLPDKTRRALIGFVGWAIVLLGVVLIPYPGPGWLTVFAGLAILATEFDWADRLHKKLRTRYDEWQRWVMEQPLYIRGLFGLLSLVTVILTVWLINGYGIVNSQLNLGLNWLDSPFVR